jgi:enterochelin esterase-like enzyme
VSLRGALLFVLVLLLTAAAFAAVVAFWGHLTGKGLVGVVVRGSALLGVCCLVMTTFAVGMNDQYAFYADWTDIRSALTRTSPDGAVQTAGGAPQTPVSGWPGERSAVPASDQIAPTSRQTLFTVTGARSHITAQVLVIVPVSYTGRTSAGTRYPVIEALHGLPGGPQGWVSPSLDIVPPLDAAVKAGTLRDAIVVLPTIDVPKGRDTECVDGAPSDPAVLTWLAEDVPSWLGQHFRVEPQPSAWSTLGISVGAYCAALITMTHPDRFGGAIVLGGYFRPAWEGWRPFPARDPRLDRFDLVALERTAPPAVAMWVQTSPADPLSYPSTSAMLTAVHPPTTLTALVQPHAGHRTAVWKPLLPVTLTWLGRTLSGFAPPR